jgi:hypothetical protein
MLNREGSMTIRTIGLWIVIALMPGAAVILSGEPQPLPETRALVEFQRAADSYAFTHRQTERRGAAPPAMTEGTLFTPMVSAVFRSRIQSARAAGCAVPGAGADYAVPRVNDPTAGSAGVPPCIAAALPRLPAELEYRMAGVALLLADAHLHIVIDVLHAAFPQGATP